MYLSCEQDGLRLHEPGNLKALSIRLPQGRSLPDRVSGLRPAGQEHGWLDIGHLRSLGPDDQEWRDGYDAMIRFAARHGWVSEDGQWVRAHVEFTG